MKTIKLIRSPGNKQFGGILDIFGFGANSNPVPPPQPPQQQAPNAQNTTPGQPLPGTQGTQQTAPNGVVPEDNNPNTNPNPNEAKSPLDPYKDVWLTSKDQKVPESLFGNLDQAALMKSAQNVDFVKDVLTPELLEKAKAGGEDGVRALMTAMNSVAQRGSVQNLVATTKIVEAALQKHSAARDAQLPSMLRKLSANEGVLENNPLLSHPALAPMAQALTHQISEKYPNATSKEIQEQVSQYFTHVGTIFAPPAPQTPADKNKLPEIDWSKEFFG